MAKRNVPKYLNADGRALYRRLVSRVCEHRMESLCALCEAWQIFLAAAAAVAKDGVVLETTTGNKRKNPAVDIIRASIDTMMKLSKLLGLYGPDGKSEMSELDEFRRW